MTRPGLEDLSDMLIQRDESAALSAPNTAVCRVSNTNDLLHVRHISRKLGKETVTYPPNTAAAKLRGTDIEPALVKRGLNVCHTSQYAQAAKKLSSEESQ